MNFFKKKLSIDKFKTYDHNLNINDFIDGNYSLSEDGIVVNGDFNADGWYRKLIKKNTEPLSKIPWIFTIVNGSFNISNNRIYSLYGSPKIVTNSFSCSTNYLESLEFCPTDIYVSFKCHNNRIKNMDFSPRVVGGLHGGIFDISHNYLESINFNTEVNLFDCSHNLLKSLKGYSKNITTIKCHDNDLDIFFKTDIEPNNRSYLKFTDEEYLKIVNSFPEIKFHIVIDEEFSKIYNSIYCIYKLDDDYYQISMSGNNIYVDQYGSLLRTLKKINSLL